MVTSRAVVMARAHGTRTMGWPRAHGTRTVGWPRAHGTRVAPSDRLSSVIDSQIALSIAWTRASSISKLYL